MYIWYTNKECIFGGLEWGNEDMSRHGSFGMKLLPIFYIYKFIKLVIYNINNKFNFITNNIRNNIRNDITNEMKNIMNNIIKNENKINDIFILNNENMKNNVIPEKLFDIDFLEILYKKIKDNLIYHKYI
jgi:hypothetical protein